jgi:hypothetical protein
VLALTILSVALSLGVVSAQPASAWTIEQSADVTTLTSIRLTDNQTHGTLTLRLRRDGDIILHLEAHCTARNRKYLEADAWVSSPASGWDSTLGIGWGGKERIESGGDGNWVERTHSNELAARYDEIVNDPGLVASFQLHADRTRV